MRSSNEDLDDLKEQCIGITVFVQETEIQEENGKPGVQDLKDDKRESGLINKTEIQNIVDKSLLNYSNSIKIIHTIYEGKCSTKEIKIYLFKRK